MRTARGILAAWAALAAAGCDGSGREGLPAGEPEASVGASPAGADTVGAGDRAADARAAGTAGAPADTATTTVRVYFTRDERPWPVTRAVPRTRAVLRTALSELLEGPTAEERAQGLSSFFSAETAGMLNEVTVDERGHAVVDFADFSRVIPNASTSAGRAAFLGELNATVFQFPTVRTVEYRLDGSCEAFWNWLQVGGCPVVPRPGG